MYKMLSELTLNNETKTIMEWAESTGINFKTILSRLNDLKWSIEKTLTTKPKIHNKLPDIKPITKYSFFTFKCPNCQETISLSPRAAKYNRIAKCRLCKSQHQMKEIRKKMK